MFYGTTHPTVLNSLTSCTPTMDISHGGNRLFYMHANVGVALSRDTVKVALTPCHASARPLQAFPWTEAVESSRANGMEGSTGVDIVLGMENGLSDTVVSQCDHCVYIPQYGSIGSLSMLSAMAIAVHSAFTARHWAGEHGHALLPVNGHMPLSNDNTHNENGNESGHSNQCATNGKEAVQWRRLGALPHEKDLISLSNDEIRAVLAARRSTYALQITVMVYNELGDRNIGAIMRNANAFNCEGMIVLNRRKFNRRGAVGTQHLLDVSFHSSVDEASCQSRLHGNTLWLLYQYYPYLKMHGHTLDPSAALGEEETFIRHENTALQGWLRSGHCLGEGHPMIQGCSGGAGRHLIGTEVYLDDTSSLKAAVREVVREGYRGIILAVPEEGATVPPEVVRLARRVVFIIHPQRLPKSVQRGLNGALASAVALERLRTAIDNV
uniref:tRNA/rRNA methyltransferase SpoU type domain-containing protein n=1 Tax=Trypanosoma vivax (strain Y486) TaxID=1055687 RepID=G0TRK3_TRYVY|nr:conserved hypothetical protein [Trypanosoma vivax Y486]